MSNVKLDVFARIESNQNKYPLAVIDVTCSTHTDLEEYVDKTLETPSLLSCSYVSLYKINNQTGGNKLRFILFGNLITPSGIKMSIMNRIKDVDDIYDRYFKEMNNEELGITVTYKNKGEIVITPDSIDKLCNLSYSLDEIELEYK